MEGIFLVQYYGRTSTRGWGKLHSGFIVGFRGGRYLIQSFTDCTMPFIRARARTFLGQDDEDISVFVAQEDVLIYDAEFQADEEV